MRSYIPPNLGDNGGVLWGLTKKRNAFEAGIYLLIVSLIVRLLPLGLAASIIIFVCVGLVGAFLFIMGINDQSVGEFIYHRFIFKRDKAVYTILLYNSYNLPDEVRGIQFNDLSPIK